MALDDLRQALRALRRSPAFSLVVALTLGLGIGGVTTMFSLVDAVLLRPLPFEDPDRLVALWSANPKQGLARFRVSSFDYLQWKESSGSFERLALTGSATATWIEGDEAAQLTGARVSADFFPLLGAQPLLGRLFTAQDFEPSAPAVVVLNAALWVGRFAADPLIVGRTIRLDDVPTVVIGVLPRQLFPGEGRASGSVVFSLDDERYFAPLRLTNPSARAHVFGVLGRLRRDVTPEQAQARLDVVAHGLRMALPETHDGEEIVMVRLADEAVGDVRSSLWTLFAAVGFLLAISCVNVTHLLLLRAASRSREIAVRAALGANRRAVARLFVAEDLLLALAGGAFGMLLAFGAIRGVVAWNPIELPRLAEAAVDGRALVATLLVCVAAGALVSLPPVLHWAGCDPAAALRAAGQAAGSVSATKHFRSALAVGETSLAVVLVVGAGLLVKSLVRLEALDPGFDRGKLLVFALSHPASSYPERGQLTGFYERLLSELATLPGVTGAAASYDQPRASNWYQSFDLPDVPPTVAGQDRGALFRTVTPGYFRTLGVEVLEGRPFTEADDAGAPGVVIVNEAWTRRFLRGRSPLGRRFVATTTQWRWGESVPRSFHIVGVVENEAFEEPGKPPEPAFYVPYRQTPQDGMAVLVRTSLEPASLVPEIRRRLRSLDPRLPLAGITSLDSIQARAVARPRFRSMVLVAFAVSALVLSLIGLSGVLSDSVRQRRREIGVRMACGAGRADVFLMLLREGLRPALLGLAVGLGAALALGRALAGLLYGVTSADPQVFLIVCAILITASVAACGIPAWRAARTDPMTALRSE